VRVVLEATAISDRIESAIVWFKNTPFPAFDYKTPQALVYEGRTEALVPSIHSLQAGYIG